jgi:hypothetical protein
MIKLCIAQPFKKHVQVKMDTQEHETQREK